MSMLGLTVVVFLAQADAPKDEAKAVEAAKVVDPAERAALAAERAAVAAEKTAQAAGRIADALYGNEVKPTAAGEVKPEHWRGTIGLGLTYLTGNAEMLTLTGNVAADRKWDLWSLAIRASGAYGVSNPAANVADSVSQVTARRAAGTVRGDRAFGSFASLFVLGGAEFDHVKNVEAREFGEAGTGLTLLNEKHTDYEKAFLRLDLAIRAGNETRVQYFPYVKPVDPYQIVILAPRAALTFRWAFNKDVRFSEELEAIPSVLAPTSGRLLVNNTTKFNARLTENVTLATALVVNFDSMPPPTTPVKRNTDVALTFGVEAAF